MAREVPAWVDGLNKCDSCHKAPWQIAVYRQGRPAFAYCLRCLVGVLIEVPDIVVFRLRDGDVTRRIMLTRRELRDWLIAEELPDVDVSEG